MKKVNLDLSRLKPLSKTCRYCHRECDYTICIPCDAKHCARDIYARVKKERTFYKDPQFFNETKAKERFKKSEILGMEGLTADEVQDFWRTFEAEYELLGSNELQAILGG